MIKNERQYRITRAQAERFSQALSDLQDQGSEPSGGPSLIAQGKGRCPQESAWRP